MVAAAAACASAGVAASGCWRELRRDSSRCVLLRRELVPGAVLSLLPGTPPPALACAPAADIVAGKWLWPWIAGDRSDSTALGSPPAPAPAAAGASDTYEPKPTVAPPPAPAPAPRVALPWLNDARRDRVEVTGNSMEPGTEPLARSALLCKMFALGPSLPALFSAVTMLPALLPAPVPASPAPAAPAAPLSAECSGDRERMNGCGDRAREGGREYTTGAPATGSNTPASE